MSEGVEGLAEDLAKQGAYVRQRTPVYGTLLAYLEQELERGLATELERAWQDRSFLAFYERPLLILGSLRYDALCEGPTHPLWSSIGDAELSASDPTPEQLRAALDPGRTRFWDSVAHRKVQTNETTRAVAWLWPASLLARAGSALPLHLVDVGTSAGLNLIGDELPIEWTDEQGLRLELRPLPPIATRLGLDLSPLDVRDEDSARWLRACVWPSDRERLVLLDRAIATFRAAVLRPSGAPQLETCAIEQVPARISELGEGGRLLVVQTIMRDYVPAEPWSAYENGLRSLIAARPPGRVVWVELEVDAEGQPVERSIVLRAHCAGERGELLTLLLARTHAHPKQLFIDAEAVSAFGRAAAR